MTHSSRFARCIFSPDLPLAFATAAVTHTSRCFKAALLQAGKLLASAILWFRVAEIAMEAIACGCFCRAIDDFECTAAAVLERCGLGQDLTGSVLSHVRLIDRFADPRSAILQALSCEAGHDARVLFQKLNILGDAKEMMLLFSLCLKERNENSAGCLLQFLVDLQHPSDLLREACRYGCFSIAERIVDHFGAVPYIRQHGSFAKGCDCFQTVLLSKASDADKTKIVALLCARCSGVELHVLRSAFNTALRLRSRQVCDLLLLRDVCCVCPLSVADALVLCSEQPLAILIAHLHTLAMSPPELYEVACTAVAACKSPATITLLLQALLHTHTQEGSHGAVKEWDLLRLAICSCNMAAVSVIHSWAAVGGDVSPSASVLHSLVATAKGEETCETLEWLLANQLSCFSVLDVLHAAEAAAFSANLPILKLLLPHVPHSPQTSSLRVACELQQQQPAALMWFALQQGVQ